MGVQVKFNEEFDVLKRQKETEIDKITDAGQRVGQITAELLKMGVPVNEEPPFIPRLSDLEDAASVLTVKVCPVPYIVPNYTLDRNFGK